MSIVPIAKTVIANFLPTSIGGCQLWLDGADPAGTGTAPANGATVSTWVDKSINGNNATQAGGSLTYTAAANGVVFDGAYSSYYTVPSGTFPTGNTYYSFFLVVQTSLPAGHYSHLFGSGVAVGGQAIDIPIYPNGLVETGWWTTNIQSAAGVVTANTKIILGSTYNLTGLFLYGNGATIASSTILGTRNSAAAVGYVGCPPAGPNSGGINGTQNFIGTMHEALLFTTALTTPQRQQVEGYLAQKWGLTSQLPAGHPGLTQTFYGTGKSTVAIPIVLIPYNLYTNYTPLTATGSTCILWLDASDPTTLFSDPAGTTLATVNGTVGYWRDKSSSGFNCTQTTLAYRPTYVAAAKNGRSILSFNGLTNFLNMPQFTAVPLTIFFVAQGTVFLTNTFFLSLGNAGSTIMMRMLHIPEYYGVDGPGMLISTTNADTNWHLWSLTISSTTVTFYFDGVLIGNSVMNLGSAYTFATNTIGAWNQQVGSKATTLRIPEILFYSAVLGTSQRQQVESYLTEKWALVSQPTRSFASIVAISKRVPIQYTQIFTYTEVNQTFLVPATTTSISVYMWGAGGAGGYSGVGGAGAFLGGLLPVTPNSSLTVIVGQGGTVNGTSAFGGGGVGSVGGWRGGGGGGGYSGIFNGSTPLAIVGAGGGAAFYNAVGGCGDSVTGTGIRGTTNGAVQSGYGGTQSAGGAGGTGGLANGSAGSYLQGGAGDPAWSAGGGGGYYGGGGGATDNGIGGSGAGGSSYSTLLSNIVASNSPNTGMNAPNTSSTYYASGVAVGGSGYEVVGGNGRVVFVYTA
jgi:hypothetical protein